MHCNSVAFLLVFCRLEKLAPIWAKCNVFWGGGSVSKKRISLPLSIKHLPSILITLNPIALYNPGLFLNHSS